MQPKYAEVIALAKQAGDAILDIYNSSEYTTVIEKADNSPLTDADLAAHKILMAGLKSILDLPIISEESDLPSKEDRDNWQQFWLIDPLDGTKEFIERNGEFTVNIALISNHEPVFGLIYAPVTDEVFYGGNDKAYCIKGNHAPVRLKASNPSVQIREHNQVRIFGSRRHATEQLERLREHLIERLAPTELILVGSALKLAYLAEGQAELYPRYGNVNEWDIAAGHAILRCVGGDILTLQYEPMKYGHKPSMIVPGFLAIGCLDYDWRPLLLT
jgi:3'(2'), 5'-bisphosphate nucleotidase